jgi:hypothetical protein
MKRIFTFALAILMGGFAFAQDGSQPQIAYRIFNDYVVQKELKENSGRTALSYLMVGAGAGFLAMSGVSWVYGDQIAGGIPGWDQEKKIIVTSVFAGLGITAAGLGLVGVMSPPADFKKQYSLVYQESDAVVQEAMAAAALKEMADRGRDSRVTGAIIGIATPVITYLVQSILNVSQGKSWYQGYDSTGVWQIPSIVSSFSAFFQQSAEERLYDKYLAAKSALYATE